MLASTTSRGGRHSQEAVSAAPSIASGATDLRISQCDCAAHRSIALRRNGDSGRRGQVSWLTVLLPLLVCAFCPACLTLWAPLLASLGLGFALPEAAHLAGVGVAVLVALAPAALRAQRAQVWRPMLLVAAGAGVLVVTHAAGGGRIVDLSGALCLIVGSVLERRASSVRRLAHGVRS